MLSLRLRAWGRRLAISGAIAAVAAIAWSVAVPALVARQVRRAFRNAGFPAARFEVADVGIGHVKLHDVVLADGLALGDVELDGSVTLLVGGRGPDRATIRGARVTAGALAHLLSGSGSGRGGGNPFHVPELRIEDAEIATPAGPIALDATLALPAHGPFAIDAHARLALWQVGPLAAHDVLLTVRGADGALHACAHATVADAVLDGCTRLPTSTGALLELHELDVDGDVYGAAWRARGQGHLAWGDGHGARLSGGHVHVDLPALGARGVSSGSLAIDADLAGTLAPLGLAVGGRVRTDRASAHAGSVTATLRAVDVPFALHVAAPGGALAVSSSIAIAATAETGALAIGARAIALDHPRIVLRDAGAIPLGATALPRLRWSAQRATFGAIKVARPTGVADLARGTELVAWRAIEGAVPLPLGPGELRVAIGSRGPRVVGGHASLLGGELTIDPTAAPVRGVVIRARDLDLAPLLALVARGHMTGRGRLDGAVAIGLAGGRPSLTSFTLSARGRGTLCVTDRDWKTRAVVHIPSLAIHRRVVAALADFSYAQLTLALAPPGSDPELRITLRGRGRAVDQEIQLAVAVHNVRNSLGALR